MTAPVKGKKKKAGDTASRPKGAPTKPNRQLAAQTRKMLGRHYAAKYRVG